MASWNYRVIEFVTPQGDAWRAIHEVYYDDDDNPTSYSEGAAIVMWDVDGGAPDEILDRLRNSLSLPVLVERDFLATPASGGPRDG